MLGLALFATPGTNLCGPGHRHWPLPSPTLTPHHTHPPCGIAGPPPILGIFNSPKTPFFFVNLGLPFFISLIKTNPGPGKGKGLGKVFHFHRITRFGFCGDTALATPVQGSIRSNQPRCGYFCSFLHTGVYMLSSTQALGIWGMQSTALGALPCPVLGQY